MHNHILIEKNNNILDIKFNRPESRNAITRDMFEQMLTTLENCKEDNELRAIFLSGEGDAFSAGGDVKAAMLLHKDAMVLAEQQGVRSQTQYKQEFLGTLYTADTLYGTQVMRPEAGVVLAVNG